jgi:hypothetical protein
MVKHLISSILFLCILQTGQAQTTPWFLSTNAFKEWVQRNHIKEIVELNPEFTNYESYKYYISISKHLKNKNLSQVEVHYCFDSLGELTMIKVTLKKIRLSDSDYQLQKDEYNKLYQKFEDIPYTLTDSILNEFVPVKGLEHLNFKSHRKFSSALIHNEEVISLSGSIKKTTENYFAFYEYDLLLKLNFSKGMLQSLESYYPGSIDTQGLPYYYKTWFEKERDSSYLLKTHSYVPRWIDERSMNRHISDTIENLSYYRNVFIGITEGDCFSDSLGNLIQNEPLIQYLETPTKSGSEFHIFSNGSKTLISLFDAYFNNSVSNSRANFGQSFHFYGPNMEKDEIFTWIPKGEFISNRKLDENGLLIRQSFSQVIDGKNQIIWVEKKTKEGYMRIQKTKKDEEHLTYFRFNRDGNFEVVENKIKDRKIIESKNRLEFTNNGFIADQNGSTNKITYIVYK